MRKFYFPSNTTIDGIIDTVNKVETKNYNEKIVCGIAIDKSDREAKLSFLFFEFLSKEEKLPDEKYHDYNYYLILKKLVTYSELKQILTKIKKDEVLCIDQIQNIVVKLDSIQETKVESNRSWGYIQPRFPVHYLQARLNQTTSGRILQYELVGKKLPPYPTADRALIHLFNLRNVNQFVETPLVIIIPDFRARIKSIKILNTDIKVEVEPRQITEKQLLIQIFVEGANKIKTESNLEITNGIANFSFDEAPEHILVNLITVDGDSIDKKEISLRYQQNQPGVIIETPDYSIKELISFGEGKHVEFKTKLDNPEPFVSSVVSFANSDGGRIFVGVDDYGETVGVQNPDNAKGRIENWIAQYCDPRTDVNIRYSEELNIMIVEVPEGKQKPYYLKTGGCYIRHGATDRQASRVEIEEMQNKKNQTRTNVSF